MAFKLKDSKYPDCKYLTHDNNEIGVFYWTMDESIWYFSTRSADDFYTAEQLLEISDILNQLNINKSNPFKKEA